MTDPNCLFCKIVTGETEAVTVFADDEVLVFLDHRPLFPGHCLVIPKQHYEVLSDLPNSSVGPFFERVQLVARVVESELEVQGTFVAMNNRVSQSVPHLHVHIVPRKKGDGLKGFFWPRSKYQSAAEMVAIGERLAAAMVK